MPLDSKNTPTCERCGHPLHRYRNLRLCRECEAQERDGEMRWWQYVLGGALVLAPFVSLYWNMTKPR